MTLVYDASRKRLASDSAACAVPCAAADLLERLLRHQFLHYDQLRARMCEASLWGSLKHLRIALRKAGGTGREVRTNYMIGIELVEGTVTAGTLEEPGTGPVTFDARRARLVNGDTEVQLSRGQADLVGTLIAARGAILSHEELAMLIGRSVCGDEAVRSLVKRVRQRAANAGLPSPISTRWRNGYHADMKALNTGDV